MTVAYTCPCCRGYIGEAAPIDEVKAAIRSPWQRRIINVLAHPVGRPVMRHRIVNAVYAASGDKAPDTAENSLSTIIVHARKNLEPFGWTIVTRAGGRGSEATYTLTPLEASA